MEIREVKSFKDMELFIQERNYMVECFDDEVLQYLARQFEEQQLFFMKKNESFPINFDRKKMIASLLEKYQDKISGKFSMHQEVEYGMIYSHQLTLKQRVVDASMTPERYSRLESLYHKTKDERFLDMIMHYTKMNPFCYYEKNYDFYDESLASLIQILHEDEEIMIFTLRLKLLRMEGSNGCMNYYESLYHVDSEHPWVISEDTHPYWYHYQVKGYFDILCECGRDYVERRMQEKNEFLEQCYSNYELKLQKERELCK